jgi:hypothetical protein
MNANLPTRETPQMRQNFFSLLLCLMFATTIEAQTDTGMEVRPDVTLVQQGFVKRVVKNTFNRYFNDSTSPEKAKFLLYPTVAFSPETSWEIGFSALLLYYANRDTTNRLSEIQTFNFFTLNEQHGAWFDHFIYTDKDKWFFLGRLRFQRFPLQYFGIGPGAKETDKQLVNSDYILIRERVLRKIVPNLFAGLELDYQKLYNVSIQPSGGNLPRPLGGNGTQNLGIGTGLVFDDRHNALNVRKGHFGEVAFMNYSPRLGSDFKFSTLTIDGRIYRTVKKNQVFAAQLFLQSVTGNAPFNQLALLGSEGLMRGYYYGRYRDKKYMAAQAEYRFLPLPFSKRLGAAAFVSTGTVAPSVQAFNIKNLLPAGGVGLRYLVFPKKDIFLRFDVGFTREGPAFYVYTGEAF